MTDTHKKINPKTHCTKCGYDWEAHEFAVPAPYCPANDEDAEFNRKSSKDLKNMFTSVKNGTFNEYMRPKKHLFLSKDERAMMESIYILVKTWPEGQECPALHPDIADVYKNYEAMRDRGRQGVIVQ